MAKNRYGNYPRKPVFKDTPYIPKVNPAVIKEWTVEDKQGRTWGQGNAPNIKYTKKKGYKI